MKWFFLICPRKLFPSFKKVFPYFADSFIRVWNEGSCRVWKKKRSKIWKSSFLLCCSNFSTHVRNFQSILVLSYLFKLWEDMSPSIHHHRVEIFFLETNQKCFNFSLFFLSIFMAFRIIYPFFSDKGTGKTKALYFLFEI